MEQIQYNLLFRWFVGLGIADQVWVPRVFTENRDRLLTTEMSRNVMAAILAHREVAPLLLDEHFWVDGTLVKVWASMKSFQAKPDVCLRDDDGPSDPPSPATIAADQSEQRQTEIGLRRRHSGLLLLDHPNDLHLGEAAFPHAVCSFMKKQTLH